MMKKLISICMSALMLLLCIVPCIPIASATESDPLVLFEEDFNDSSYVGKTNETLLAAIFGESNYITGETVLASISDGKLNVHAQAGGSNFIAKLASNDAISEVGFVVECEYVFNQRTVVSGQECDARWFGFNCKSVLEKSDKNCLLTYVYNGAKSRVAFRNASATREVNVQGDSVAASGDQNTKYKLRSVFDPEDGPVLSVATWDVTANGGIGDYGSYQTLGGFTENGLNTYRQNVSALFSDNVMMNIQHGNNVTIDNLKISLRSSGEQPEEDSGEQSGGSGSEDQLSEQLDANAPLFIGYQIGLSADEKKMDVRLVSVVKSMAGTGVGYVAKISYRKDGRNYSQVFSLTDQVLYDSLSWDNGLGTVTKTANELCEGYSYLFGITLENLPADPSITVDVTPYILNEEGKKMLGEKKTFECQGIVPDYGVYNTQYGTFYHEGDVADGVYRVRVTGTNRTEYNTYIQKLQELGYTLYGSNTINNSAYNTYISSKNIIHAYFEADKSTTRILYTDEKELMSYLTVPVTDSANAGVATPSVTLMSMDYSGAKQGANGAGFVFTMSDGSFVIVDGGWSYDTDTLYNWLSQNNKRRDGKILIRAWIITHPHEDHYGNFESFASKYANNVTLEYFVANLGGDLSGKLHAHSNPNCVRRIYAAVSIFERSQNTKYIVPQVGQIMYFGEMKLEFLHTQERLYPDYRTTDGNDYSLVFKAVFANKTFLMTGDAYPQPASSDLVAVYGNYLKSDYVQAPHHGMGGTSTTFYDKVDADYIFVNTSADALAERLVSSSYGNYGALQYVINTLRTPYYVADNGYQTIKFN